MKMNKLQRINRISNNMMRTTTINCVTTSVMINNTSSNNNDNLGTHNEERIRRIIETENL